MYTTKTLIRRTTIKRAELADNILSAKNLVAENFPVLLIANKLTDDLRQLSLNPLVQLRFTRHDDWKNLLVVN